jgi:hypothetical protein
VEVNNLNKTINAACVARAAAAARHACHLQVEDK